MDDISREQLHISVRKLVEFIFRSGDIDEGQGSVDPVLSMREGQRIHKKIQESRNAGYVPEVGLKTLTSFEEYDLLIDGRADGIQYELQESNKLNTENNKLQESNNSNSESENADSFKAELMETPVMVEEIKGVYMDLDRLEEPIYVHLAQAKCYAFILCKDYCLDSINIRMTYCNLDTEEIKIFEDEYASESLIEFWNELIGMYKKWADFSFEWKICRNDSIFKMNFPYEYRNGQRKLVGDVYKAITEENILFIQAPTGSGKTVSTIYPSIQSLGRGLADRVFYLTGKTVTKTVAIDTLKLLDENGGRLKSIELTAKDRICPMEERHCNPDYCEYAKGHFDRVNDAVYKIITENDIITKAMIIAYAEKYKVCPFEFSLDIALWCDVIIGDYNYVFHPTSYLKRFFGEANSDKYVFLIDEAHNLVDRGRSMYSETLYKEDFLTAKKIIKDYDKNITRDLTACNKVMVEWKKENPNYMEHKDIDSFMFKILGLLSDMEKFFERKIHFDSEDVVRDFYFKLRSFRNLFDGYDEKYIIYTETDEAERFVLHLFCMDPSRLLQERLDRSRCTVFFSATLLPMNYYGRLLCTAEHPYAVYAKTVFSENQKKILIGSDVTTKYTERSNNMYDRYAMYIYEITRKKTGNYIVFFPSYKLLEDVYDRFSGYGFKGRIMIQRRDSSEKDKQDFLDSFLDDPDESMVAFSVMGGLYSEGIDLTGNRLIGVIIVGTGLPMISTEREILKGYFDSIRPRSGFEYSYLFPGMCKVLQAAGRLIRTVDDRGIVALLDNRFQKYEYRQIFPAEWQNLQICDMNSVGKMVDEFWEKNK